MCRDKIKISRSRTFRIDVNKNLTSCVHAYIMHRLIDLAHTKHVYKIETKNNNNTYTHFFDEFAVHFILISMHSYLINICRSSEWEMYSS